MSVQIEYFKMEIKKQLNKNNHKAFGGGEIPQMLFASFFGVKKE